MPVIAVVVAAYLIGGIPFGWLVARMYGIADIRTQGSGNIGATNVWRVAGAKAAIWVYLGDIGKGAAAVAIARAVGQQTISRDLFLVVAGLAAVVGHVFPIYLRFRGGKGVNTALGVMLTLLPWHSLIALGVFVITVAISKYISLGSMVAGVCLFGSTLADRLFLTTDRAMIYPVMTGLLMLIIIWTHRSNLTRIADGTENRFSFASGEKKV
ncbi:MAG: glycerol-3-phosphate 1-O-acyltransferase PlsY [candidate division Zixibacteria bacterium]|nr:glycerol-3-phosphate 1-O-acyltransferase PlsY [candidate division Zixibacteria bacterium]